MRQIDTSSLSNQNISNYLLVHTYTADADRAIFARIHIDQIAGNGEYDVYLTIQAGGIGPAYMEGPITAFTAPSGQTSIGFVSILVPVNNGDVVKFYVKGLAGDINTPDIVTRIFELTYLRPTTAGRTLDVTDTGEAGLDFANINAASAPTTLTNITVPTVTNVSSDVGITQAGADKVWSSAARTLTSFGTLIADFWGYANRTLSAFGFTVATNSDGNVTAIKAKTDNLPDDPASNTQVNTRLATASYTAPDNAGISAIKANVDAYLDAAISAVLTAITTVANAIAAMSSVRIVYHGPVVDGGAAKVERGDDYYDVDGRALSWTITGWSSLVGATIAFACGSVEAAGSVVANPDGSQTVKVELSRANTTALVEGVSDFTVRAVRANGHEETIIEDKITAE